jgi:TP901 family phage tail tape measure protein
VATNRVVWTFFAKDKFSRVAAKIKARSREINKEFRKMRTDSKSASKAVAKLSQSLKRMAIVGVAALAGSLKAFGNMEAGITNVLTLLDDKQIAKFGGAIQDMATKSLTEFGFSTEETTKALFDNVSALGTSQKSLDAFAAAQRLAIGGVTSLDVSVDGITSVMNAYADGLQTSEAVANAFFASQKAGKVTVAQLAANVGKVAPIAKSAGIGYKELLATMSQLTLGGLSPEEAATSLKGAITSLLKPSAESAKILAAEGIAYGASALGAQSLVKTLEQVAKLREKNEDLLIQAIPNIRGFTAVASLEYEALKNITNTVATMQKDQLSPAFEMQMKTLNAATRLLKGNFVAMGISIGAVLAPAFVWIAGKLTTMIKWFNSLSATTKKWIVYTLVGVGALIAVFVAAAAIVAFFGTAFAVVGGAIASAAAAVFGAIVSWPFAIIAALVIAGGAIWAFWDDIKGVGRAIGSWFGMGDGETMEVKGSGELATSSKFEGNLAVGLEKGLTGDLTTKSSGDTKTLDLATNMEGATG